MWEIYVLIFCNMIMYIFSVYSTVRCPIRYASDSGELVLLGSEEREAISLLEDELV